MTSSDLGTKTAIIPTLHFQDGEKVIVRFYSTLCVGDNLVVADTTSQIAHAQLTFGNGMIMLGSANNNSFYNLVKSPVESGGIGFQSVYVFVAEIDQHDANTLSAGAEIAMAIRDEDYGGWGYSPETPKVMSRTLAATFHGRNNNEQGSSHTSANRK